MFQGLSELFSNPVFIRFILSYFAFMAFAGALPSPAKVAEAGFSKKSLLIYGVIFMFIHLLSINFSRAAVAFKLPGAQVEEGDKKSDAAGA